MLEIVDEAWPQKTRSDIFAFSLDEVFCFDLVPQVVLCEGQGFLAAQHHKVPLLVFGLSLGVQLSCHVDCRVAVHSSVTSVRLAAVKKNAHRMDHGINVLQVVPKRLWRKAVAFDKRNIRESIDHAIALSRGTAARHANHLNFGMLLRHSLQDVITDVAITARHENLFYWDHKLITA